MVRKVGTTRTPQYDSANYSSTPLLLFLIFKKQITLGKQYPITTTITTMSSIDDDKLKSIIITTIIVFTVFDSVSFFIHSYIYLNSKIHYLSSALWAGDEHV